MGAPNAARRHSQQEAPPATRSLEPGWAHPAFLTNRSGRPTNLPVTNMEGRCPRGECPHSSSRTRAADRPLAFVGLPKSTPRRGPEGKQLPWGVLQGCLEEAPTGLGGQEGEGGSSEELWLRGAPPCTCSLTPGGGRGVGSHA